MLNRVLRGGFDQRDTLGRLLAASGSAGNLTIDTPLAALGLTLDAVPASIDAGFTRVPGAPAREALRMPRQAFPPFAVRR